MMAGVSHVEPKVQKTCQPGLKKWQEELVSGKLAACRARCKTAHVDSVRSKHCPPQSNVFVSKRLILDTHGFHSLFTNHARQLV